jgi:hypothetical protein
MIKRACRWLPAVTLIFGALPAAVAQNLLVNGGFATNLDGWTVFSDSEGSAGWASDDANGSPGSGSAILNNTHPTLTNTVLNRVFSECVPVVGLAEYDLAGKVLIPAGQPTGGKGWVTAFWTPNANCSGFLAVSTLQFQAAGEWTSQGARFTAPAGAQAARVQFGTSKDIAGQDFSALFDDISFTPVAPATSCVPSPTVLCVDDQPGDRRFRISVTFETVQGGGREGQAVAVQLDSLGVTRGGLFWFFRAENPEMLIKVLNGCPVNDHYWVFYSAGTNVGFEVQVTDTHTEDTYISFNPDLRPAPPVQEGAAFPCD